MKIMKELSALSAPLMIEESECSLCSRWQKLCFNFIWFHLAAGVAPAHRAHKSLWLHSLSIFSQKPLKATKFSTAPHEAPNGCHSGLDRATHETILSPICPPPNKISHFTKEYLSKHPHSVWCQHHYFSTLQVSLPQLHTKHLWLQPKSRNSQWEQGRKQDVAVSYSYKHGSTWSSLPSYIWCKTHRKPGQPPDNLDHPPYLFFYRASQRRHG